MTSHQGNQKVKVYIRCKPLLSHEVTTRPCVTINNQSNQVSIGEKVFFFDNVFNTNTSQLLIYNTTIKPLVDGIFQGFNATVVSNF